MYALGERREGCDKAEYVYDLAQEHHDPIGEKSEEKPGVSVLHQEQDDVHARVIDRFTRDRGGA